MVIYSLQPEKMSASQKQASFYYQPMVKIIFFATLLFCCFSAAAQTGSFISVKQKTEVLENHRKITTSVDLFLNNDKQTITKYYHASPDFIMHTNALGEIKTYYPESNEVAYRQIAGMSSKRNLLYYFANNLIDNLGLVDEGFQLVSNGYEGSYYVTVWQAPSSLQGVGSVKMVFENGLPVYSEYQASKEKIMRKIYYANYQDFRQFRLPMQIVEISYKSETDSIISRTSFSDVKVSLTDDNSYFNFKIPEDAKPISKDESQ